jgi:hypothetical protein
VKHNLIITTLILFPVQDYVVYPQRSILAHRADGEEMQYVDRDLLCLPSRGAPRRLWLQCAHEDVSTAPPVAVLSSRLQQRNNINWTFDSLAFIDHKTEDSTLAIFGWRA